MDPEGGRRLNGQPRFRLRAAAFLIAIELMEKVATFIILTQLISYLMDRDQNLKMAAKNVNYAEAASFVASSLGAFVIVICNKQGLVAMVTTTSITYFMGSIILMMSELIPMLKEHVVPSIISIFLLFLGIGRLKSSLESLSGDQFNDDHPLTKHLWKFGFSILDILCTGIFSYITDIKGWKTTYITLVVGMGISIVIFFVGRKTYRFEVPDKNAINHINLRVLAFVWLTCAMFGVFKAQASTFFSVQTTFMTRVVIHGIEIPSPTIYFISIIGMKSLVVLIEKVILSILPTTTDNRISILLRMVVGMMLTVLAMVVASVVEMNRLEITHGLATKNRGDIGRISISVFWILPQGLLLATVDVFFSNGVEDYFSDHVPTTSYFATGFYMSAIGIGCFISSLLINAIDQITRDISGHSWIGYDLNSSRVDNFYWVLTAFSIFDLIVVVLIALKISSRSPNHANVLEYEILDGSLLQEIGVHGGQSANTLENEDVRVHGGQSAYILLNEEVSVQCREEVGVRGGQSTNILENEEVDVRGEEIGVHGGQTTNILENKVVFFFFCHFLTCDFAMEKIQKVGVHGGQSSEV